MKILEMKLENFQGMKKFHLVTDGMDVSVHGTNGTGKTTLYNAFCWLLYGKPSTDEKNYSPQTAGTHNLEHSAEMALGLENGAITTLKKSFHEVYKAKRGNAEKFFAGYTTDYFVDGVPVKETDYKKKLAEIYDSEDTAKLLTRCNYFLEELPVKERRALLLDMCGGVSFQDVVAFDSVLSELEGMLDNHSIDEAVKIWAASKKKIDAELKTIQPRIDEAAKAKPEIPGDADRQQAETEIRALEARKAELEQKRLAAGQTAIAEIRKQIADAEAARAKAEAGHAKAHAEKTREAQDTINGLVREKSQAMGKLATTKADMEASLKLIDRMKEQRDRLIKEGQEAATRKWEGSETCPTCGQRLPEGQIREARENFNRQRSEQLEAIQKRGQEVSSEKIQAESERLGRLMELAYDIENTISGLDKRISEIDAGIGAAAPFAETAECREYDMKLEGLRRASADAARATERQEAELGAQIAAVNDEISSARQALSRLELAERQDCRIKELEAEKKRLAADYEKIEKGLHLCELFSRRKAEMLTDSVNGMFATLKFRLFKELQNGGIEDDCEAMIPCGGELVQFKGANNAARINAGLEAIDVISRHMGFSLPIWIDNAESCVSIIPTGAQQIRLYVSEADKELRVEAKEG